MTNYKLNISYNGNEFEGWQSQPNKNTIQDKIIEVLEDLYQSNISLNGSGRTDAKVHAKGMVANFQINEKMPKIPPDNIKNILNSKLPKSIRINSNKIVDNDFHARFSALGKTYSYVISKHKKFNPFLEQFVWHIPEFDNICEVRKALQYLEGEHDFSSFTVKRSNIDNAIRTIYKTDIVEFNDFICINFSGNGFLYKMIRSIMGSIKNIGIQKQNAEFIKDILDKKNRSYGEKTAPPNGLFLMEVYYNNKNDWQSFELKNLPFL